MIKFDILTLFPQMCKTITDESILGRAQTNGAISVEYHNIRDYANNKHNRVDDYAYGGGMGMLMQPEPIYSCYTDVADKLKEKPYTIYMSPKGKVLTQDICRTLSEKQNIVILCGHYEGVDQRVLDKIVDEEISIGDYVLTGGELPALVLVDAVSRMCSGVLSNDECFTEESHYDGLLEYPQYTRPEVWRGEQVPEVLLSGHHENIRKWRRKEQLILTEKKRPDLYKSIKLSKDDKKILGE